MEELTREDWDKIASETERVYRVNEVDIGTAYYHMPNSYFYPSFFVWDSGFQAIAMLHLDPDKAKRELETLFAQVAADGHMPHEVLIPCAATRARTVRNFARWIVQWEYDSNGASHMIDPPVYVYSAKLVYDKTRDKEWLARIWPELCRALDYLLDERNLFGDGLLAIVHPWEAGTDMSPQLTPALGIDASSRLDFLQTTFYAALLYRFCNRNSWDMERLAEANKFVFEDLTLNCIAIRALMSASALAAALDDDCAEVRYRSAALYMAGVLERVAWDEEHGCYFPRWDVADPRRVRVKTAASCMPLFAGLCRPERAKRLAEEHLLNPREFHGEHLVPFNPADELTTTRPWVEKKLWAGHCIWINFNWMMAIGLAENGYAGAARELTLKTVRMIEQQGFWEYYDSLTGEGRRVRDFTWPGLALDMMARFWPEAVPPE